jgi:hypothetical protein
MVSGGVGKVSAQTGQEISGMNHADLVEKFAEVTGAAAFRYVPIALWSIVSTYLLVTACLRQ